MKVNHYYSTAVEQTDDDMLHLCRECAAKHADQVQWASRGDEESECEFCDATNSPERTAELNALFAKYSAA